MLEAFPAKRACRCRREQRPTKLKGDLTTISPTINLNDIDFQSTYLISPLWRY